MTIIMRTDFLVETDFDPCMQIILNFDYGLTHT